jgi:MinD-like ATPase involved in chromosome partitioning or flagellar assembly
MFTSTLKLLRRKKRMGKCISIHSSRGGTGKTLLATNIAVLLAKKGFNVALLDLDFRSPSLVGVFSKTINPQLDCYLNTYLDGRCPRETATVDLTLKIKTTGKLLVSFANPDVAAVRNMAEKSRSWEVSALKRLFALRSELFNNQGIDYCIYDTSPGIQYTSVNAVVSSDLSVIVSSLDSLDIAGTESLLVDLYAAFEKKTAVILNKVYPENQLSFQERRVNVIKNTTKRFRDSIIGEIPCYCKVLLADRSTILAAEEPEHAFVKKLEDVTKNLVSTI